MIAIIPVQQPNILWEVIYHSNYAVWNHQTSCILAKDKDEALDTFWEDKNKEHYEIISINRKGG